MVSLLGTFSWGVTFAGAAAVSVLVAGLVAVALRDTPPGTVLAPPASLAQVRANLRETWHEPGTKIGLFTHGVVIAPLYLAVRARLRGTSAYG